MDISQVVEKLREIYPPISLKIRGDVRSYEFHDVGELHEWGSKDRDTWSVYQVDFDQVGELANLVLDNSIEESGR